VKYERDPAAADRSARRRGLFPVMVAEIDWPPHVRHRVGRLGLLCAF
jgi:hypothetical protein